jgi:hypothetical protein
VPSSLPTLNYKNFILCRWERERESALSALSAAMVIKHVQTGFFCVDFILYWYRIQADTLSTATTKRLDVLLTYGKRPRYLDYVSFTQAFVSLNYANLHFRRLSKKRTPLIHQLQIRRCWRPVCMIQNHSQHADLQSIPHCRYWKIFSDAFRFELKKLYKTVNTLHETPRSFMISRLRSNRFSD